MHRYITLIALSLFLCHTAWAGESPTIEQLVAEGMTLKDQGKFTEAEARFETALKRSPKSEIALIGLGRTYGAQGAYKKAENAFLKAIKSHPRSLSAHRFLSLTYMGSRKMAKAEKFAKKAVKLAPKDWETLHGLAEIQIARQRWDAAIKTEKKVLKLDPKNLHACTGLIRSYQSKADYKRASKYARKATQIAPKLLEPRIKLAELYALQGKRKRGVSTLKEAETLLEGQIRRIAILATSYVFLGANENAAKLYSDYVKKNPKSAIGHAALAEIRVKQKKFKAAEKHARLSKDLDPKSPMPYQILGVVAALKKDYPNTEKYYTKAIQYAPKPLEIRLRYEFGMLLLEMKKPNKAIIEFETILKKFPDAEQINRPLCQLYRQLKRSGTRSKKVCLAACKQVSIAPKDCSLP